MMTTKDILDDLFGEDDDVFNNDFDGDAVNGDDDDKGVIDVDAVASLHMCGSKGNVVDDDFSRIYEVIESTSNAICIASLRYGIIRSDLEFIGGRRGVFASMDLNVGCLINAEKAFLTWDRTLDFTDIDNLTDVIIEILSSNDIMILTKQLHPRTIDDIDVHEKNELIQLIDNHDHYGPTYLQYLSSTSAVDVEEIIRIGLVLQHNGFQSGLYSQQSLFNHSCDPNCIKLSINGIHGINSHKKKYPPDNNAHQYHNQHDDNKTNHSDDQHHVYHQHNTTSNSSLSEIWSIKPIALGEELTISYYHPLESASECIRQYLQNNHKFICRCKRCELLYSCRIGGGDHDDGKEATNDDDTNTGDGVIGDCHDGHCDTNPPVVAVTINSQEQQLYLEIKLEEQLQIMEDNISVSSSMDETSIDPVQVAEVEMLLDQMKDLKCRYNMSSRSSSSSKACVGSVETNANNCDVVAAVAAADNDVDDDDHDDKDINDGSDSYSHSPSVLMKSRIYKIEHSIILSYIDLLQQSNHTTPSSPPPQPIVEQLLRCLLDRYTTYLQYLHHQHPAVGIILDDIAEVTTLLLNSYPNSFRTTFRDINFMDAVVVIPDINNNMIVEKTSTSIITTKIIELSGVVVVPQTQSIPSLASSSSSSLALIKRFIDYCRRQAKSIRSLFHSFTRYPCTVRLLTTRAGSFYWGKRWV